MDSKKVIKKIRKLLIEIFIFKKINQLRINFVMRISLMCCLILVYFLNRKKVNKLKWNDKLILFVFLVCFNLIYFRSFATIFINFK
jgi:hypothetical protein